MRSNEAEIRSICALCSDVIFRRFGIGGTRDALIVYVDGLVDAARIEKYVIAPLLRADADQGRDISRLSSNQIIVSDTIEVRTFNDCVAHLLDGYPILLCDGEARGLALGVSKWEKRAIEDPVASRCAP